MSPEQLVAILVAITGVLGAVGVVLKQLLELRADVNGRLTQLLEAEAARAKKEGELAGRDYADRLHRRVGDTPISSDVPLTES